MRGLYLDQNDCFMIAEDMVQVAGKPFQHLSNVIRIRIGEAVLVFDGQGKVIETIVSNIKKKEAYLEIKSIQKIERKYCIDLAVGIVKKDALESVLKIAVELGLHEVIPMKTDFSQPSFLKKDRIERLCESALIQSNNPFMPIIKDVISFKQLDFSIYDEVFCFSSNPNLKINDELKSNPSSKKLMIIGPEGGFSEEEEKYLIEKNETDRKFHFINLPTPILRTPTAMAVAMGVILEKPN